jgi:hypothetical protein
LPSCSPCDCGHLWRHQGRSQWTWPDGMDSGIMGLDLGNEKSHIDTSGLLSCENWTGFSNSERPTTSKHYLC